MATAVVQRSRDSDTRCLTSNSAALSKTETGCLDCSVPEPPAAAADAEDRWDDEPWVPAVLDTPVAARTPQGVCIELTRLDHSWLCSSVLLSRSQHCISPSSVSQACHSSCGPVHNCSVTHHLADVLACVPHRADRRL